MYESRRELLYSFLVFLCSVLIGAFSALHDDTFVRLIMGNDYVDMTLDNIRSGKPMAVYGSQGELGMFLAITSNNIYVSFRVFITGLLTGLGTGMMLLYNGVMVGGVSDVLFSAGSRDGVATLDLASRRAGDFVDRRGGRRRLRDGQRMAVSGHLSARIRFPARRKKGIEDRRGARSDVYHRRIYRELSDAAHGVARCVAGRIYSALVRLCDRLFRDLSPHGMEEQT